MSSLMIEISSRYPMHIEVDANRFGEIFAEMGGDDQVSVFRAMIEHMRPHRLQWDHIAIELEKPENHDVLSQLREVLFQEVLE